MAQDPERERLGETTDGKPWRQWGPYLSQRQWGTVREDYSPDGNAWESVQHDHARSRAYRWGEDGLLGICDDLGLLCCGVALWNEADPILKERLFGLTGPEGNHGEDVKEYYFFLDNTPTHSYMRALYKYPQTAFPYAELVAENRRRGRHDPEYELIDTGAFADNRYFDVQIEYAKAEPRDILWRITITNHSAAAAPLHVLPGVWFSNTWSWGRDSRRPSLAADAGTSVIQADHSQLGSYWLALEGTPELLFTENETNTRRLWGLPSSSPYVKDGINDAVVGGNRGAVNPGQTGTKAAGWYRLTLEPGAIAVLRARLADAALTDPFGGFDQVFAARQREADLFYAALQSECSNDDERRVQRQALAGLLWSKQHYYYDVGQWLDGDPAGPQPPATRLSGRNSEWRHLNTNDVLSMPDTWEYPWFAAWDLMFQCLPLALVDPVFAKEQIVLLLREWYMHPNGQLPACEWSFGDVNPPVQAWAAWRVYRIDQRHSGKWDRPFLERVFHKLMLNFTWWVNRKDSEGRNVFQGGFLGLDNIGVFDRSRPLPGGELIEQADGTAWMGMYCLTMMVIALELALDEPIYQDVATKFFEHFLYIAGALNNLGGDGTPLWDEDDQFFYDVLRLPGGHSLPLRLRSLVGLIPLLAVETIEQRHLDRLSDFRIRMDWFLENRPELASLVSRWQEPGAGERRLLALVRGHRMKSLLARMLDPAEFLSPYGVRSLSRWHLDHPYRLTIEDQEHVVTYHPGESTTALFGGNSNWRGPVWFPINFLLIEALRNFHDYYGDGFRLECPTGSGQLRTVCEIADDLAMRLISLFTRDAKGRRPVLGDVDLFQNDPRWRDCIPFHEYFHGDTGRGVGASHQTGWTALVASLIDAQGRELRHRESSTSGHL